MYNYYTLDFYVLADWLTPRWLRKEVFMILLKACLYPLVLIHNAFIRYRDAKLYEMKMNYQVCYMEAFLNDRFDFTLRRIYIDDGASPVQQLYLYQDAEERPIDLYKDGEDIPVDLYLDGEYAGSTQYDFIVYVPTGLVFDEHEMRAMIATKLCGKKYSVQLF